MCVTGRICPIAWQISEVQSGESSPPKIQDFSWFLERLQTLVTLHCSFPSQAPILPTQQVQSASGYSSPEIAFWL